MERGGQGMRQVGASSPPATAIGGLSARSCPSPQHRGGGVQGIGRLALPGWRQLTSHHSHSQPARAHACSGLSPQHRGGGGRRAQPCVAPAHLPPQRLAASTHAHLSTVVAGRRKSAGLPLGFSNEHTQSLSDRYSAERKWTRMGVRSTDTAAAASCC